MRSHCSRNPWQAKTHTWCVDNTAGADTNNGNAATPIQTIAKVNATALKPGDRVLFKCAETWKAQSMAVPASGKPGRPIYFGKYGAGANPIIDPTTEFNDWELHGGVTWDRDDTGNNPSQVWEDGVRMIYKADVASVDAAAGSWCKTGGRVYVHCSDGGNPSTGHVVEYSLAANNHVVQINGKSHLVFDGIDYTRANYAGYVCDLVGTYNVLINNCNGAYNSRGILIGTDGVVTFTYPTNITIRGCTGHDDLNPSYWIGHGTNLIVEYCTAYNNGADVSPNGKLYPSASHFPNGILISAEAINCIVRYNYVYNIYNLSAIIDEKSGGLKGTNTRIYGNHVDQTGQVALAVCLKIEGTNTSVYNNWLQAGAGNCIMLGNVPTVPLIYHNTLISPNLAANSMDCVTSNPGMVFKNNIVIRAGSTNRYINVPATSQAGTVINNNLYYGASTQKWFWGPNERTAWTGANSWVTTDGQDAAGVNDSPHFVADFTDVHLTAGSHAVAAGDATVGVLADYDSVVRGVAVDIGAYEYV